MFVLRDYNTVADLPSNNFADETLVAGRRVVVHTPIMAADARRLPALVRLCEC